jgi:hypothetical protein
VRGRNRVKSLQENRQSPQKAAPLPKKWPPALRKIIIENNDLHKKMEKYLL